MGVITKLLKMRFAVVSLVILAAVFAITGFVGFTHEHEPPTTFVYPVDVQMGSLSPEDDGNRFMTKTVDNMGVPVLSIDEQWPVSGVRCGPATPTLLEVDMRLASVSDTTRFYPPLFPQNPVPVGNLQGADESGNAACIHYSTHFEPGSFSDEAIQMIREQGPILVQLVFLNEAVDTESMAPVSVVSEPFYAVAGDPGNRTTIVQGLPSANFDPSVLDSPDVENREELFGILGRVGFAAAALCLLMIPAAALLPVREALKAERRARQNFLNANPDPILTTDLDGRILRHSPAVSELLREPELAGRTIDEFLYQDDSADTTEIDLDKLERSYDPTNVPIPELDHALARRSDGEMIPVDVSHSLTELEGEERIVYVIRDASDRVAAANARVEIATAQATAEAAGDMLAASHHSLNREVLGVGFALDDLLDDPTDPLNLEELKSAYVLLEQGRDELYAIATLSRYKRSPTRKDVTARDLTVVGHDGIAIEYETVEPLKDVDPLILRLAITNAARNAAKHGRADLVRVTTWANRLKIEDNGGVENVAALERAWCDGTRPNGTQGQGLQIIKRCAEATGGEATIVGSPTGVTIDMNFTGGEHHDLADRGRVAVG